MVGLGLDSLAAVGGSGSVVGTPVVMVVGEEEGRGWMVLGGSESGNK